MVVAREKRYRKHTFDLKQRVHEAEYSQLQRPIDPRTKRPIEPAHKFEVNIESDSSSLTKLVIVLYSVFLDYQTKVHKDPEDRWKQSDYKRFLCSGIGRKTVRQGGKEQKLGSYHQCYRLDGQLIAVGVLDMLPHDTCPFSGSQVGEDQMTRPEDNFILPDEEDMSLFDIDMPGVLTLDELKAQVDLDHCRLLVHNSLVEMTDLVGWESSDIKNPHAIKGIIAELAATLGPKSSDAETPRQSKTVRDAKLNRCCPGRHSFLLEILLWLTNMSLDQSASKPSPSVRDIEKDGETQPAVQRTPVQPPKEKDPPLLRFCQSFWHRLATWGVELRGIVPISVDERTDKRAGNVFLLWFTVSCNLLPVITGMVGTLSFGLGLRDASLVIIFFNLLCTIPPAYLSILGPKTGLRQMIQARYTFGIYLVNILVLLNLATVSGFTIIDCVIGGQTLSALNDGGGVSVNVGIAVVAVIALFISFFGYRVLHRYERYGWIPILVSIIIATGCGGKHLSKQADAPPASAPAVLSFGGLIAGFLIPWAALSSDFCTYISPDISSKRIFSYVYLGLFVPTVPLMILGAAIGGAVPNVPDWAKAYKSGSVGGIFAAMLSSAGGFGKFITVLLAFSTLGNIAATIYSITLNFQILLPILVRVPRALFALVFIAIIIPVSIRAAASFFLSLENFIGVIAYWSAAFFSIVTVEHLVFRKGRYGSYDPTIWNVGSALPSGVSALAAGLLSFALVIPCMSQTWYVGPIAKKTGDIGFEVALGLSALLYLPLRAVEVHMRKRL
ncbi:conserved hypothetical protein [Uncinocarpus reesii 1704]|uniref:N-end rule aminoacyl transferase C-terminal domain-containing protein n=1 Tax=Uncinocarpus reesii (strain UAMH 1704) TaxID=336963 RepID=C4JV58_UNCRE|nr:uncharacterized protein UREG_06450 [Uncinocarpus reesii 1704]EEP81585.1 conserved hypothetical protein [Uncinocarpus reesii 1704]